MGFALRPRLVLLDYAQKHFKIAAELLIAKCGKLSLCAIIKSGTFDVLQPPNKKNCKPMQNLKAKKKPVRFRRFFELI